MKLTQMKASRTHRALIFGRSKSGKTELTSKLALKHKIRYIGLENGHEVFFKLPPEAQERVEIVNIPDTRGYPIAIETCLKMVAGPVDVCEQHGKVQCMLCKKDGKEFVHVDLAGDSEDTITIFDSLTQLTNSGIAFITKNKPDDYRLDWEDWGKLGKLMDTFLSYIQQATYNVVCISHEVEVDMEDGKKLLVPCAGTRNFSCNTAKYFDTVIYSEVKSRKHTFGSSSIYSTVALTGSRKDVALEGMVEVSLESLFTGGAGAGASADHTDALSRLAALKASTSLLTGVKK